MTFEEKFSDYLKLINNKLDTLFVCGNIPEKRIYEAAKYSLLAGGKRIRPIIALGFCDMLSGVQNDALVFAVAIECIHTYSLIHDDLPCMDDDDLRRGKATCHKAFDEATAALDVFHARKVITNIMTRNKNQTCIITTHRYSILSICDHVYQIKNNQLIKLDHDAIVQLERIF